METIKNNNIFVEIPNKLWQSHGCSIMLFVEEYFNHDYKVLFDKEPNRAVKLKFATAEIALQVVTIIKLNGKNFYI